MKFGVLLLLSWPDRRVSIRTVYDRALERIETMDGAGYDAVWIAEHHFTSYSVCPSVHMLALAAAERTHRLRIGTGISLVPFYHPLRLAEEIAMLDVLSGGRVNWGAGRGYQTAEYEAFGVDPETSYDRFREGVAIVFRAWTEERFSFAGRFWQYRDVEVLPKPLQDPHPPFWLAASSSRAIGWAAEHGHSILMDPVCATPVMRQKRQLYHERLAAHGFTHHRRDIPMARLLAVADTAAEAREVARAGAHWYLSSHEQEGQRPVVVEDPDLEGGRDPLDPFPVLTTAGDAVERFVDSTVIHGTPEAVIDQIRRLREEIYLDYLLCAPLSHRSFQLLTDEVMPRLASSSSATATSGP